MAGIGPVWFFFLLFWLAVLYFAFFGALRDGPGRRGGNQAENLFIAHLFGMLAKLAKADGVISRAEIDNIEAFMRRLNFSKEQRERAITYFNQAKSSDDDFADHARRFAQFGRANRQFLVIALDALNHVARAGGAATREQEVMLKEAAQIFGLSGAHTDPFGDFFRAYQRQYQQHYAHQQGGYRGQRSAERREAAGADDYTILGAKPSDSFDVIRKKHRALVREYHPDTLIGKGLPQEMVDLATEKVQVINAAFERIKSSQHS